MEINKINWKWLTKLNGMDRYSCTGGKRRPQDHWNEAVNYMRDESVMIMLIKRGGKAKSLSDCNVCERVSVRTNGTQ